MEDLIDDVGDVEESPVEEQEAPQAVETGEPEQQEEDFSPDWLNAPVGEEPTSVERRGYTPEQLYAYQQQQAYMQNQQQYPNQQRSADEYLNEFVRDPNGYMSNVARREAAAIAQQMMQQGLSPVQARMDAYFNAQVEMQTAEASRAINNMYKSFSKDESFKGNKRVKEQMDSTLRGLFYEAQQQARMGNPRGLMMFQQPGFAEVALAAVKAQLGVSGRAKAPSVPHVESTAPSTAKTRSRELDPDTEAAIERLGRGGRDRYFKALEDLDKYQDFEG